MDLVCILVVVWDEAGSLWNRVVGLCVGSGVDEVLDEDLKTWLMGSL